MLRGCKTLDEQKKIQSKGGKARMAKARKSKRNYSRLRAQMARAAQIRWGWPVD